MKFSRSFKISGFLPFIVFAWLAFHAPAARAVTVLSPDGKMSCAVVRNTGGQLSFSVAYNGQAVVQPSLLGVTVGGQNLGASVGLGTLATRAIQETYPRLGGHATATNACNEALIPVTSATVAWTLEVRVFNDGVAYRYRVPGTGSRTVAGETSQWVLPTGGTLTYQDAGNTSYESTIATSTLSSLAANTQVRTTGVVQLPGAAPLYVMMTEANLVGYSDLSLNYAGSSTFGAVFRQNTSGWSATGEVLSPWRVTIVAPDLNTLVNTDILPNLCPAPAPDLANAAWIKPGRSVWEWLVEGHPVFANQTKWVDWTSQVGFEYYLIDDGWKDWTANGLDAWACMKTVTDYARTRGVGVWAWVHTNEVTTAAQRTAYFQKAKDSGLVGLKIDFMGAPDVTWVQWYDDTLAAAASFQLMIDFHGCVKPTGRERTWPHELTREAVDGRENGTRPGLHDTALPFTRYVQGHADYTPTDFRGNKLGGNSYAHELAQAIVYTSPFLCTGGDPLNYLQNPALDVLRTLPATWDETRVLPGSAVGQVAGFARRKGSVWFIGVVNGATAGSFSLNLSFLNANTPYVADKLADSSSQNDAFVRTRESVSSASAYPVSLRAAGGYVARIVPAALLPAAPAGVTATGIAGGVQVAWNAVSGATGYTVGRATTAGGPYATVASGVTGTGYTDPSIAANTRYYYVVTTTNAYGPGDPSAEISAVPTSNGLAAAWSDADVGNPSPAGYGAFLNGVYTLNGAGSDIWTSSDQFHFTSQAWSGDGVLTARVTSQPYTNEWAKFGVMFRESSAANSRYAFMLLTPGNGAAFQLRAASGNLNTNTTGPSAPYWVQLVRVGDTFTGYASSDGATWTQIGAATSVPMAANVLAGLALCSHSSALSTASMDHVSLLATPPTPGAMPLSESQLNLVWTDRSTGETGYAVERSPAGANTWTVLAGTLPPDATGYADSGLAASTGYDYRVRPAGPGVPAPAATFTATTPAGIGDGIPGAWRYRYFGNGLTLAAAAARDADPDGDGRSNLLEYATGSDPTRADPGPAALPGQNPERTRLTLTFNRIADPALTYRVVATPDLTTTPWPETVWSGSGASNAAGPVTVPDTALISDQPRRFLRLEVSAAGL